MCSCEVGGVGMRVGGVVGMGVSGGRMEVYTWKWRCMLFNDTLYICYLSCLLALRSLKRGADLMWYPRVLVLYLVQVSP